MRFESFGLVAVVAAACGPLSGLAEEYSGDVWGTWTKGSSPHIIVGDVRVPPDSSLAIQPGCQVLFRGHYKFTIDQGATLLAVGSENDSISFDEETPGIGWHGLRFTQADSSSRVSYCSLKHGKATGTGEDAKGGAIYCQESNPRITSCTLDSNQAAVKGGAIYCSSSTPVLTSNLFTFNSAEDGGAVCWFQCAGASASDNTFISNSAETEGGAVYCHLSSITLSGNTFTSNYADYGGGAVSCLSSSTTISGNTFDSNSASAAVGEGGGLHIGPGSGVTAVNNVFSSNTAEQGGALSFEGSQASLISSNTFTSNVALQAGGIYSSSSGLTVSENTFQANSAEDAGGALRCPATDSILIFSNDFTENTAGGGGAIDVPYQSFATITGNTFTGNSALYSGGALACFSAAGSVVFENEFTHNSAGRDGGAICAEHHPGPVVSACTFSENHALRRGGAIAYGPYIASDLTGCTFMSNWADSGGALYSIASGPTVSGNMFSSNSARYDGGAIYWDDSGDSIAQNTFDANSAARNGGAIYMRSSGEVLSHNVFWQNTCVSNGGAVYFEDPDIQVINNSLFGNSAGGTGGGMYFMSYYYSNASVINTILWGDSAGSGPELYVYGNAPEVTYCDVQGGWTGEENVDSPPLFRNSGTGDFHLMALACGDPSDSPCIDAGHPDTVDAVRDCVHGLGDARSDMGAYGGRNSGWVTGVGEEGAAGEARSPRLMIRNFPNPMREGTTISYWLPVLTEVRLDIYNILGEKVASLIHERQDEGYHEVAWGSTPFPPGMYFCRVTAGGVAQTGRMVRVE